jgi:hypothetical protein
VIDHHLGPRSDGTSARRTLHVDYNDDGVSAGLPEFLFTKSSPTLTTRLISAAASLGLASHLTVADRRSWERDLVARHGERLAEAGIAPPADDQAFLAYRQQMLNALWMWIGTVGRHRVQPDMQPADVSYETVRRTAAAVIDLEALDAVHGADRAHRRVVRSPGA